MRTFLKEWRSTILIGIAIAGVGFFLRIYNLTHVPIFADEAIYIRWAQVMEAESTLRFLPLSDGKQPLFMWSVIPFLQIFDDPLLAGRFVSVLCGMLTSVGIFFLTHFLFRSKTVGLIASLAWALSPYSVFFDRMALVDSMLAMFGVWTLFFATTAAKTLRLDYAMFAGFGLGAALLTKSPAFFFALFIPTAGLMIKWPKGEENRLNRMIRLVFLWIVTWVIGYSIFNILRLGPNFHLMALRNEDYVYPLNHILTSPLDPLFGHLPGVFRYFLMLGPAALIPLVLLGLWAGLKNSWRESLIILIWTLPLFVISEYTKVMTARYILFVIPFFCILAASSFSSTKIMTKIATVLLIIFVVHSIYVDKLLLTSVQAAVLPRGERSGYLEEWTSGYGIAEAAKYIKEEHAKEPDKKIVVGTEGYFGTLPDGLQLYLNSEPEIIVIGIGLSFKEVHPSLVESKKFGNKTYLVVNSSRFNGDADKLGLELIDSYPKALREPGSREYDLYGPQEFLYLFELSDQLQKEDT